MYCFVQSVAFIDIFSAYSGIICVELAYVPAKNACYTANINDYFLKTRVKILSQFSGSEAKLKCAL